MFRMSYVKKKNGKFPLLRRYVFYHIDMEVKENTQTRHHGRLNENGALLMNYLKISY